MRKLLISLLLASAVATPALADPSDWSGRHQAKENRQQVQQDNGQARDNNRGERPAERPSYAPQQQFEARGQFQPRAQSQPRGEFQGRGQFQPQFQAQGQFRQQQPVNGGEAGRYAGRDNRGNFAGRYDGGNGYAPRQRMAPQPYAQPYAQPQDYAQQQRDWRRQQYETMRQQQVDNRDLRQSRRPVPGVMRSPNPLVVSNVPRPGTQPPMQVDPRRHDVQWNTGWRDDDRYDWRDYRQHHRSIFHLGFYYDPYGWNYMPYQIGWRMWPGYYESQFWINDPWDYHLPYAPAGYVWVRYWNDALLIDTWSGTVVDVIPGFFW